MKTFRLFSMAALALMMAACSSEDNALETASPAMPGKLQFTATVEAPGSGATTRTEYKTDTDDESKPIIKVAWKENDEIAAIVTNSEGKLVKTVLKVSKVNDNGSAVISGDITKPKDDALTVDLIYPEDIVTVAADGSGYSISFEKMRDGSTLDGTLDKIAANIDYRRADACPLTVSGDKATLTIAAKLVSKLSIWKLTLQDEVGNALSASKVSIADGAGVMASATLATAGSTAYLPVLAATGNICISATTADNDYFYMKEGVTLAEKKYYQSEVKMTKGAHLAFLSADYEAKDGETLTGKLGNNVKISIAAGATVKLKNVQINQDWDWHSGDYAGITCAGDATITLDGMNKVMGFNENYPAIQVPSGNTLTINGDGRLYAFSAGSGAGIGGCYNESKESNKNCGNIDIKGGEIMAHGGFRAAGIGGGYKGTCGNIEISGGRIIAQGGPEAAGIGSGASGSCNNITITSGVTGVEAMASHAQSIGKGAEGSCGTVTIDGVVNPDASSTFTNFNFEAYGDTWRLTHK